MREHPRSFKAANDNLSPLEHRKDTLLNFSALILRSRERLSGGRAADVPDEDVLEIGAWLDELEIAIRRAETALEAAEQHTNDDAIFREAKGASDELHEAYSLANYALNNLKL